MLANHDDVVDSYGVELRLEPAGDAGDASATVTVTAADGASLSFDATRSKLRCSRRASCTGTDPIGDGLEAADARRATRSRTTSR